MRIKRLLSVFVLIILIVWFVTYINTHLNEFKQIKIIHYNHLFYISVLTIIFLVSNGLQLRYLLEPFKIRLPFKEWFGLSVVSTFGNYLTPFRGGMGLRAIFLKNKYQFSYSLFVSTLAAAYIIVFLVNSLIGVLSMMLIYLFYNLFSKIILTLFLTLFLFCLFIVIFSPKFYQTKYKLINKFLNIVNGWSLIKSNYKILTFTSFFTFLNVAFSVLIMYLEFSAFGINISWTQSLFLTIVSTFSIFLSITPGSLGIKESILVFSANLINISSTQALSVAILDRVINLIIILILGPIFSYILMRDSKSHKMQSRKNDKKWIKS